VRTIRSAAVAASAALVLGACGNQPLPPADSTYSVRGQVVELPASARGELTVHHEDVPDFRDRDGKPSHMDSMAMPFALAPGLPMSGIEPGDKVAMTFEVRWTAQPALRITKLEELPADTALDLGGPKLELVAPLGSSPAPTPAPEATPSGRPAADGPASLPPSETI
jgi:Cu/Ag efflux protein CusF